MSEFKISYTGVTCLREDFGIDVFNDIHMREHLNHDSYAQLKNLLYEGQHSIIDRDLAGAVATAMKNWAVSRGATHYCHWFQPLSGVTAEKHDSFIGRYDPLGRPLLEFDAETLVRGAPDASSFPSGGLRSSDCARGYTVWDPQSPAFLRHYTHGSVLCIPTAFTSWTGEALDCKTPLLKSDEVLSRECLRSLHFICGGGPLSNHDVLKDYYVPPNDMTDDKAKEKFRRNSFHSRQLFTGEKLTYRGINRVFSTLGCEQEFFVVDRQKYQKRIDLVTAGRTVCGLPPPKGQELEDQYFHPMPKRVLTMIQDAENQLWRLGVPLKNRHNEVAPGQHEVAPVFECSSLASDHNMLTMTVLSETASRHNLQCLFHEKPFNEINGSGKHHNWSMSTNTGKNLLTPPREILVRPETAFETSEHLRFCFFLTAVICAVDDYATEIRGSIASRGQDFRLGANEAPPAIMSVFLGENLTALVDWIIENTMGLYIDKNQSSSKTSAPAEIKKRLNARRFRNDELRHSGLPTLHRDRTDRNRSSPLAFTGNRFEFRAAGSSVNPCIPTTAINSAVSATLRRMNDEIENALLSELANVDEENRSQLIYSAECSSTVAVQAVIAQNLIDHYRIIFDGNSYSKSWVAEAAKRGLPNYPSSVLALTNADFQGLYVPMGILGPGEVEARKNVALETFTKNVLIESRCLLHIVKTIVLPSTERNILRISQTVNIIRNSVNVNDSLISENPPSSKANSPPKLEKVVNSETSVSSPYLSHTPALLLPDFSRVPGVSPSKKRLDKIIELYEDLLCLSSQLEETIKVATDYDGSQSVYDGEVGNGVPGFSGCPSPINCSNFAESENIEKIALFLDSTVSGVLDSIRLIVDALEGHIDYFGEVKGDFPSYSDLLLMIQT